MNNSLAVNLGFLRQLVNYAYEMGYHEHGYDVLEETLRQLQFTPPSIRSEAERQLAQERFLEAVEREKQKLRNPWWKKILPYTITIRRRHD